MIYMVTVYCMVSQLPYWNLALVALDHSFDGHVGFNSNGSHH